MTTRAEAVAEAMTWLNTPYHHMARRKGAGVDCAQILIEVFHAVGLIPRIDVGFYPHDWHFHRDEERYLGWIQQYAHRVETPQAGDIILYRFGRTVSHAAIVVDYPLVIHSYFRAGVVLAKSTDPELRGREDSYWSLWSE
jgi:cell wall-associated NlpC family hydrolase